MLSIRFAADSILPVSVSMGSASMTDARMAVPTFVGHAVRYPSRSSNDSSNVLSKSPSIFSAPS